MTATSRVSGKKASDHERPAQANAKPLPATVRRGALWSVASAAQLRAANVITTAVIAHILDPRDFGIFAVALTAYTIVYSLGEFGVGSCLVRADLDIDALAPTMNTVAVATSAVQAAAMILFAKPIAVALGSPAAAGPIKAMALVVIIIGIFTIPSTRLIRDFRQDKVFLAEVCSVAASTVVLLLLAKTGSGAMAFAWSRVVGQFVTGCVVFVSAPKDYRFGVTRGALSVLFRIGLPLGMSGFVNYILLNVDYALIGHQLGATALGTYVLAFNVATWPASLLGFMISNVSMPAFSRVKDDADRLKYAIVSALRAISLVVMPMSALTVALARPLVLTLYGTKWAASAKVLSILALYGAISLICLLFANMLAGLGRTRLLLLIQIAWIVVLVPAMTLGVRFGNISGAAFAHIVVIGPIVLPCYLFALRKAAGVRLVALARAVVSALLASLIAALVARGIASQFTNSLAQLIMGLAAGSLIYLVAVAPQAINLLNRGRSEKLYGRRILRFYNKTARLVGLPGSNGPRHSIKGDGRHAPQTLAHGVGRPEDAELGLTDVTRSDESQLAALDLLISLARPVPVIGGPMYLTGPLERYSIDG
jgi:lipopolysaccharide exporter